MELWMEGALCVLCVLGLCALGWVLLGRLLRPIPARNVRLVIAGRGAGEELEQTVRGLMWLRGLGLLSCPVVIADVDLTPQGWPCALPSAGPTWPCGRRRRWRSTFVKLGIRS